MIFLLNTENFSVAVHENFPIVISSRLGPRHREDGQVTVRILSVSYTEDGAPQLTGETVIGTRRQVLAEEREMNIKTLLSNTDDELTGLEVQEITGKGKGIKVREQVVFIIC